MTIRSLLQTASNASAPVAERARAVDALSTSDVEDVREGLIRLGADEDVPEAILRAAGTALAKIHCRRFATADVPRHVEHEQAYRVAREVLGPAYLAFDEAVGDLIRAQHGGVEQV